MKYKIFVLSLIVLGMLMNPVSGYNNEIDNPKDYSLTKYPETYICDTSYHEEYYTPVYTSNNRYVQRFYPMTDEGNYIINREICVSIYTIYLYNDDTSMDGFENLKEFSSKTNNGYSEVAEINGFGEKSYKIVNFHSDNHVTKHLIFVKNHVIIDVRGSFESQDFSDLINFANLYENKIDSVLNSAPQLFATIELEKGAGSTYQPSESFMYYITLSENANVLVESQVNNDEWTFMANRFYNKGQYHLYASVMPPFGNEKLRLSATSLKGSEVVSTVSFITKEKEIVTPTPRIEVVTPSPTIDSTQKTNLKSETPFLNPFIVFGVFIVVVIILNRER